jgi:nucleoside-diphosphate kinase
MSIERTLSIIKPDAVSKNVIGKILARFEDNNLNIIALQMRTLSREEASKFYAVHEGKPFFSDLLDYITSGPVVVSVLEGQGAVNLNRELMGATNPKEAEPGTIRAEFAQDITANAVHGSDSIENAAIEVAFFFPDLQDS